MLGIKTWILVVIFGTGGSVVIPDFFNEAECHEAAKKVTWAANSAATCVMRTR